MKAYLSGAMEHAPDGGRAWRKAMTQWLTKELNHSVYDPLVEESSFLTHEELQNFRKWKESDYPRFKSVIRKLIERDLKIIETEIDYIICYWDEYVRHGGGTHGELTFSYHLKIPIYTVLGIQIEKVSSWILGCSSKEFESFEELKKFLYERYGNR